MKRPRSFSVYAKLSLMTIMFSLLAFVVKGQTAGGSIVLAHCGAYVQFNVNYPCDPIWIKSISLTYGARVEVTINGSSQTHDIAKGDSIQKGGFSGISTVRIKNIEKGTDKKNPTCNGKGPADSDIRIMLPDCATAISYNKIPVGTTCAVCKANFSPITE
jgi:hypothetical protein